MRHRNAFLGLIVFICLITLNNIIMTNSMHLQTRYPNQYTLADSEGPVLSLSINPEEPRVLDEPTVTITAIDSDGVDTVILSYMTSSSGLWINKTATAINSTTYTASLPVTDVGTNVTYRAYANDTVGNWAISEIYSYITKNMDQEGPEIVVWYAPIELRAGEDIIVFATLGDPNSVTEVIFSSSRDGVKWTNESMIYNEEHDIYTKNIGALNFGDSIQFKVYGCDGLGNWAVSETITLTLDEGQNSDSVTSTDSTTTTNSDSNGSLFPSLMAGAGLAIVAVIVVIFLKLRK